jgi:prepilin-type N-terminal cleavage/methylation domain-containing protein
MPRVPFNQPPTAEPRSTPRSCPSFASCLLARKSGVSPRLHFLHNAPYSPLKRAFTLLEILIAIALTAILLTGISMVSFNVLEAWASQAEDPLFDRHVDGLQHALEECLTETNDSASGTNIGSATTGTRPGSTAGNSGASTRRSGSTSTLRTPKAVFSAPPASVGVANAPYLRITGSPQFLPSDNQPLGYVHGWLRVEGEEGLVLYWQTDGERTENRDDTHRLILSPWVTEARFSAYSDNNDTWTEVNPEEPETIESGSSIFMQLTLLHRGQTREISIVLADAAPHNLNY